MADRPQLPKAYLRLDPNIDQTHPDNLDEFVRLLCAANRQPHRGTFRSRAVLEAALGKQAVRRFYLRGDVTTLDDGRVVVPGWVPWQEGDMTVAERMRALRLRNSDRNAAVTAPVTPPVTNASPPSEASWRHGVMASDVPPSGGTTARAPDEERWDEPEGEALTFLAKHGCYMAPGNGYHRKLISLVEHHGEGEVLRALNLLARAGIVDGDTKGFVFGVDDALRKKPDLKGIAAADREEAEAISFDERVRRTKQRQAWVEERLSR